MTTWIRHHPFATKVLVYGVAAYEYGIGTMDARLVDVAIGLPLWSAIVVTVAQLAFPWDEEMHAVRTER